MNPPSHKSLSKGCWQYPCYFDRPLLLSDKFPVYPSMMLIVVKVNTQSQFQSCDLNMCVSNNGKTIVERA